MLWHIQCSHPPTTPSGCLPTKADSMRRKAWGRAHLQLYRMAPITHHKLHSSNMSHCFHDGGCSRCQSLPLGENHGLMAANNPRKHALRLFTMEPSTLTLKNDEHANRYEQTPDAPLLPVFACGFPEQIRLPTYFYQQKGKPVVHP